MSSILNVQVTLPHCSHLDRPGLKGLAEIGRLSQAVLRALRLELERNHSVPIKGDVTVYDALLAKVPTLR
jgi:nuclear receptor subfamily 1 group F protein 4